MRKGMGIVEIASQLGEHPPFIWRLLRKHTRKDYMSAGQKSILKHADELVLEVSYGCADLKNLQKKLGNKMEGCVE